MTDKKTRWPPTLSFGITPLFGLHAKKSLNCVLHISTITHSSLYSAVLQTQLQMTSEELFLFNAFF